MFVSGIESFFNAMTGGNPGGGVYSKNSDSFIVGRVKDVNLNTDSDMFKSNGKYFGIGAIRFQDINNNENEKKSKSTSSFARPLLPFIKEYPLVNEYVIIFKGPSTDNPGAGSKPSFYYLPLKLWNNNESNAYPDPLSSSNDKPPQSNKSNQEIESGSPNESISVTPTIDLNGESGGNFSEKGNIHPILAYAGDRILEGRFGNSIRLGSTAKSKGIPNDWSSSGTEGSPILILKNGQPSLDSPGFVPIVENINSDPSSVYLTTTQKIPIKVATSQTREGEGATIPFNGMVRGVVTSPRSYNNPQIILSSGRLLFNTLSDDIIFSSKKSIIVESNKDSAIRSRTGNVNLLSPEGVINIGDKTNVESAILGDSFLKEFSSFLTNLNSLLEALGKEASLSVAGSMAFVVARTSIQTFLQNINKYKSKKTKIN